MNLLGEGHDAVAGSLVTRRFFFSFCSPGFSACEKRYTVQGGAVHGLLVCGCVRAGSYDVLSIRNLPFEVWSSETISFYDDEPVLVKSEYINEKTFKKGEVLSVYTGYSMLSDKTFRRDIYQQNYVKADKDGVLNSASVPHIIKAG